MSRPRIVSLLWLAAAGLGGLYPRPARAQNPAAAEALFEQARTAMAAGSFDIACARFRDSDKLDPALGTRFNLADCEERRGHVATAWSLFRGVFAELANDDDRKPIAQQRAHALEPRMPYVTLSRAADTPPGMRVRIDGIELSDGSFGVPLPMDPGAHELTLLPPNGAPSQRSTFALREGEHSELPIRLASAPPSAPPSEPAEPFSPGSARRKWAYVVGGVGAAGLAFGTVTGIITLNKRSTVTANCSDARRVCNQAGVNANESGKTFAALSGIGLGIGVLGLAAGAYLWLTDVPAPARSAHSSPPWGSGVRVRPDVSWSSGASLFALDGSF